MTATLAEDARRLLVSWTAPDRAQEELRESFLRFVDEGGQSATERDHRAGHLTASTLLLDARRAKVLLTLHPLVGAWVQLGGHLEPGDESVAGAAAREVVEESGIEEFSLDPVPLRLDRHPVTCRDSRRERGPSVHYDVTFLAVAGPDARARISDESLDLAWFGVADLPPGADGVVADLVARCRERGYC